MKIEPLRDLGKRYAAAWSSQDAARVAEFFTPTAALKINDAEPCVGRESITTAAQGFMSAFPDMVVTMDDITVQENHAVFHWTLTGTNPGPGGTGRRVRISGYEEWTLGADGLIADSEGHFSETDYQRQLNDRRS